MDSRNKILNALANPSAHKAALPDIAIPVIEYENPVAKFSEVLRGIGGSVVEIKSTGDIEEYLLQHYPQERRIVSTFPISAQEAITGQETPHAFESVDIMLAEAQLGVAENGAVWITDTIIPNRVLPFICQHLMVVLKQGDIVPTLQHAYSRILDHYDFGTFIAGPSKTADIEQSLVLGAHGPKTMTVFLLA